MKQARDYPTVNSDITLTTYAFSSTGASGAVNASGGVSFANLSTGDSIILGPDNGSANGFTASGEYFIIAETSGACKLATTHANAIAGTPDTTASGDAGVGTIYPNYKVGGPFHAKDVGDVYLRGIGVKSTGWDTFSIYSVASGGHNCPYMIKDIASSGTTAGGIVSWSN